MVKSFFSRETCLFCVSKHLAQAQVLLDEARQGYPLHRWLAVGHLAEAESEALTDYPLFAQKIRCTRMVLMGQECTTFDEESVMELLAYARKLAEGVNHKTEETSGASVLGMLVENPGPVKTI